MYQYGYSKRRLEELLVSYCKQRGFSDALRAIEYAAEKHAGQKRMNGQPFIIHPYFVAWYGICSFANDENWICANLLHDVCEDCGVSPNELPFSDETKEIVGYLTFDYHFDDGDDKDERRRKKIHQKGIHYAELVAHPKALISKGFDRYHNLLTVEDLPENNIRKNVLETHRHLLPGFYDALTLSAYEPYHMMLYKLSIDICGINDHIALTHDIELNTMS